MVFIDAADLATVDPDDTIRVSRPSPSPPIEQLFPAPEDPDSVIVLNDEPPSVPRP
jgi:hypothetical protein